MSSKQAIRDLDADIMAAFADEGHLGDTGTYTDSDVTAAPVTVMIDRAVQRLGEYGQVVGTDTQIGLQLSEVAPKQGGTVKVDNETFKLGRRVDGDGSVEFWTVTQ